MNISLLQGQRLARRSDIFAARINDLVKMAANCWPCSLLDSTVAVPKQCFREVGVMPIIYPRKNGDGTAIKMIGAVVRCTAWTFWGIEHARTFDTTSVVRTWYRLLLRKRDFQNKLERRGSSRAELLCWRGASRDRKTTTQAVRADKCAANRRQKPWFQDRIQHLDNRVEQAGRTLVRTL